MNTDERVDRLLKIIERQHNLIIAIKGERDLLKVYKKDFRHYQSFYFNVKSIVGNKTRLRGVPKEDTPLVARIRKFMAETSRKLNGK